MSRIALVSYFAPPQPAVASHRVLRLSRFLLAEGGHEVHWVTLDPDRLPKIDETLLRTTPPEIRVHGLGGVDLVDRDARNLLEKVHRTWIYKLPDWRPVFDRHRDWTRRLIRYLPDLVEREEIDTVLLCCGPHGQLEVVPRLRERFGDRLKIVVDYRDLLSGNTWRQSASESLRRKVVERERQILSQVDLLSLNNESAKSAFERALGTLPGLEVVVARNAADLGLAEQVFAAGDVPDLGPGVHLGFFGTIFPKRRLMPVLRALEAMPDAERDRVTLHVYCDAHTSTELLRQDLEQVGAGTRARVLRHDYLGYGDALRTMRAMDALVLINSASEQDQIFVPGKLYDYLMAQRPVLFVGAEGSARKIVAGSTGEQACFNHEQAAEIGRWIAGLGSSRAADVRVPDAYRPSGSFEKLAIAL